MVSGWPGSVITGVRAVPESNHLSFQPVILHPATCSLTLPLPSTIPVNYDSGTLSPLQHQVTLCLSGQSITMPWRMGIRVVEVFIRAIALTAARSSSNSIVIALTAHTAPGVARCTS